VTHAQSKKIHILPLEYCKWEDELYIKFPEEMAKCLDWDEQDMLEWEVIDDKTVAITRKDR